MSRGTAQPGGCQLFDGVRVGPFLVYHLASIVHKWELAGQLDCRVEALSAAQQVNALQHAGVQWYHEEYIPRELNIKPAEPVR